MFWKNDFRCAGYYMDDDYRRQPNFFDRHPRLGVILFLLIFALAPFIGAILDASVQ